MAKKLLDAPIYIDTYRLAGMVYNLRFSIPKRDRAVLGERLLDAVLAMLTEFTLSYELRGSDKLAHTDRFLAQFSVFKSLMRLGIEKKVLASKRCVQCYEYIKRIDDGIIAWRRNVSREVRSTADSNDDRRSGLQEKLRGGDGIIHTSSGSAP